MTAAKFIRDYLADTAKITIARSNGDILYEGEVMDLPRMIAIGATLKDAYLGGMDDIAIVIE